MEENKKSRARKTMPYYSLSYSLTASPEPHPQNHSIMDEMALISSSTTQLTAN
jgi:hypothetical protein